MSEPLTDEQMEEMDRYRNAIGVTPENAMGSLLHRDLLMAEVRRLRGLEQRVESARDDLYERAEACRADLPALSGAEREETKLLVGAWIAAADSIDAALRGEGREPHTTDHL